MNNKQDLKRLIEAAKRRSLGHINLNKLNEIIDPKFSKKNENIINQNNRRPKIVKSIGSGPDIYGNKARPNAKYLTKVNGNFFRIELPQKGAFNASLIRYDSEKFICVYRPDEYNFIACYMDNNYNIVENTFHTFQIKNCADPRLIWNKNDELIMIYSSNDKVDSDKEYICGNMIVENKKNGSFVDSTPFRVSPINLSARQKNWMPFEYKKEIYLISSVCPHEIYHLVNDKECKKIYHTNWKSPWFSNEQHRGNTNAVKLNDGNYLATFHTVMKHKGKCYYDNGCYIFSGKPPFNVLKCSNRTYLPAEAASEKHFRKENEIVCNFPVGMMNDNNKIIISYGDNDSVVKIVEYNLSDLINTMVDV